MMDRKMTLVADEGMRILSPMDHKIPYFLASNDELWEAWRDIQSVGTGSAENWIKKGWKITTRHLPNGSTIMTLDIRFDPCNDND